MKRLLGRKQANLNAPDADARQPTPPKPTSGSPPVSPTATRRPQDPSPIPRSQSDQMPTRPSPTIARVLDSGRPPSIGPMIVTTPVAISHSDESVRSVASSGGGGDQQVGAWTKTTPRTRSVSSYLYSDSGSAASTEGTPRDAASSVAESLNSDRLNNLSRSPRSTSALATVNTLSVAASELTSPVATPRSSTPASRSRSNSTFGVNTTLMAAAAAVAACNSECTAEDPRAAAIRVMQDNARALSENGSNSNSRSGSTIRSRSNSVVGVGSGLAGTRTPRSNSIARSGPMMSEAAHDEMALRRAAKNSLHLDMYANAGDSQQIPLFEYWAVCGTQPDDELAGVKVLRSVMRPGAVVDQMVAHFCFPGDPPPRTRISFTDSMSAGYCAVMRPIDCVEDSRHSFIFTTTAMLEGRDVAPGTMATYYGVVVLHDEILEVTPACMQQTTTRDIMNAREIHMTLRAYCFVSRFPFFQLFWQLLYEIVRNEHRLSQAAMMGDFRTEEDARVKGAEFATMLQKLVAYPAPPPGIPLDIKNRRCMDGVIHFQVPPIESGGMQLLVASTCVAGLLRALSPPVLTQVFCALLLEESVLLVAMEPGRISACAVALVALMRPFDWTSVFIPLVPRKIRDAISSPVPYLMGMVQEFNETHTVRAGAPMSRPYNDQQLQELADLHGSLVVHLDRNTCVLPPRLRPNGEAPLPQLPQQSLFESNIQKRCDAIRLGKRTQGRLCEDEYPWRTTRPEAELVFCGIEEVSQYIMWILHGVRSKLPFGSYADDAAISDRHQEEILVGGFHEAHQVFMRRLLATQHYAVLARQFPAMPEIDDAVCGAYGMMML